MSDAPDAGPKIAGIPRTEYAARVERARAAAAARGLDGLLVVARGGGPFERHANVLYLTGHYTTFPAIPDALPHWRLRGHTVAVVGADGVILLSDDDPDPREVHADEVRPTGDLIADVEAAVRDAGLRDRRVGLVGTDVLSAHHGAALDARVLGLVPADDLLSPLRAIKSPAEQELLRAAGRVGGVAIATALATAVAGATAQDAAAAAAAAAMARGAAVANVFAGVYGPDRPTRRRAFPPYADDAPIREGDVFAIDMSGSLDGYSFDFSRSRVAGEDLHGGHDAMAIAFDVVTATVDALRPGTTIGEAADAGFAAMAAASDDLRGGGFDALGHGLGLGFEAPWVTRDDDTPIVAGMCIAIEKFVSRGQTAAAFEHNVIVTHSDPEIVSVVPEPSAGA